MTTPTTEDRERQLADIRANKRTGVSELSLIEDLYAARKFLLSELDRREQEHQEALQEMIDRKEKNTWDWHHKLTDARKAHAEEIRKAKEEGWDACAEKIGVYTGDDDATTTWRLKKANPHRAPSPPPDHSNG